MRPRILVATAFVAAACASAPIGVSAATDQPGTPPPASDCSAVQYPEFAGKAAYYGFHSDKLIFEIKPWSELSRGKQARWARAAVAAVDFNCRWPS